MFEFESPESTPAVASGLDVACRGIVRQLLLSEPMPSLDFLASVVGSRYGCAEHWRGPLKRNGIDLVVDGDPVSSLGIVAPGRTRSELGRALGLGVRFQAIDRSGCGIAWIGGGPVVLSLSEESGMATILAAPRTVSAWLRPVSGRRSLGIATIRRTLLGEVGPIRAALGGITAIYRVGDDWLLGFNSQRRGIEATLWMPRSDGAGRLAISFDPSRMPTDAEGAFRRLGVGLNARGLKQAGVDWAMDRGRHGVMAMRFEGVHRSPRRR